ncbi:MAG TPA: S9 family peptidase [Gammaproteobacteria bacterium]
MLTRLPVCILLSVFALAVHASEDARLPFQAMDVFQLELAADPQVSPDGRRIAYVRQRMDVMTDRTVSDIWIINADGSRHEPVVANENSASSPRFSPDGKRLLYAGGGALHVRYLDSGRDTAITHTLEAPSSAAWSPDGQWIAFTMRVPAEAESFAQLPSPPEGASWAEPPKFIDELLYRADGAGYLDESYTHIFVVPAEGGTPRQLTNGDFHHGAPVWSPDGTMLYFSANRADNWRFDPLDSEIHSMNVGSGELKSLTDRDGPDSEPAISPNGRYLAYTGFDDEKLGHHVAKLHLLDLRTGNIRVLTEKLDRSATSPVWDDDGKGLYFLYDSEGTTRLAYVELDGDLRELAGSLGGLSIGRPYTSAAMHAGGDTVAFTLGGASHPADLAVYKDGDTQRLTRLNDDLFAQRRMAQVEELWFESGADGRRVQAWVMTPPDFDATKKYPLILEVHGGPFSAYGPLFSAEMQLYAARGYVVLYVNPRGSTSYGKEFANLIHHNYPGQDYDDLMSAVDTVIKQGYIDTDELFVTGGSGGGVLTAWIIGKTDRFRAAVVAKPVINWISFALTADFYTFFHQYWFADYPWNDFDAYWERSPLSLVGNVKTPTMLMTGEADYRTPISETEQFYQALQLRGVDTALVRVPGASHSIASRPSHLIAKAAYIIEWFERHRKEEAAQ